MSGENRRSLLTRGLVLIGGAIGLGASSEAAAAAAPPPKGAAKPTVLVLRARAITLQAPARKAGERIRPGDHGTLVGELVDARGRPQGRFYGSRLAFDSGLDRHSGADASVELHTFKLDGGTILGMGSTFPGESAFAIVGGTGRYAGARGSYEAVVRLRELGGDSTAHFVLKLSA
jgi:hypothetical protein